MRAARVATPVCAKCVVLCRTDRLSWSWSSCVLDSWVSALITEPGTLQQPVSRVESLAPSRLQPSGFQPIPATRQRAGGGALAVGSSAPSPGRTASGRLACHPGTQALHAPAHADSRADRILHEP